MAIPKETIIKVVTAVLLTVILAVSSFVLINGWLAGNFDSIDSLRKYIESYGIWGAVILLLIQILQVILPVIPGFMGCIVGAVLFGAAGGFVINYIGISAGSIMAFFLAKHYGASLVDKMVSMEKYDDYIKKINQSRSYPLFLFVATLMPLAPDDFLCYFSGLINMPVKKFIFIIVLGKPWCILFYSVFFSYFT